MIKKFILCDQAPWLWSDLNESDESMIIHGGHRGDPYELKKGLIYLGSKAKKFLIQKIFSSLADNFSNGNSIMELEGMMKQHFNYSSKELVKLLINHYMTDWRDILPIIDVPTLIITGKTTFAMDLKCADYLHKTIKNSELVVFTKEDKGNHIMVANAPEKFNKVVIDFLKK